MCKCMSTNLRDNGTVQFTFFFIVRLNITIITSCDLLIVILVTCNIFHHESWIEKWTEETHPKRR